MDQSRFEDIERGLQKSGPEGLEGVASQDSHWLLLSPRRQPFPLFNPPSLFPETSLLFFLSLFPPQDEELLDASMEDLDLDPEDFAARVLQVFKDACDRADMPEGFARLMQMLDAQPCLDVLAGLQKVARKIHTECAGPGDGLSTPDLLGNKVRLPRGSRSTVLITPCPPVKQRQGFRHSIEGKILEGKKEN
jgi:hypothetical protein